LDRRESLVAAAVREGILITFNRWEQSIVASKVIDRGEAPEKGKIRVAVYGTLRHGEGNHMLLQNSRYLGTARVSGYRMHDFGPFPVVVETGEGEDEIVVEVYEVTEEVLGHLDLLEGHPRFYKREKARSLPIGERAWIYLQSHDKVSDLPTIERGDWCDVAV